MKIHYVTYPAEKPWSSDFAAQAFRNLSKHQVIPTPLNKVHKCRGAIVHFHNIQNTRKTDLSKIRKENKAIIAGVRGVKGIPALKKKGRELDAIAVNIDRKLRKAVSKLHPNVYVSPTGVDTESFKPPDTKPKTFIVAWVGREHKKFKNANLLKGLGHPYKKATYYNYTPHHEMPSFYQTASVLVKFSEHEGLGRDILEAAACGLPIISTNVGVAPHILDSSMIIEGRPEKNLGEYRKRLEALNRHPELAHAIGLDNHKRALEYDWRKIAPKYDRMWEEVLNSC